MPFDPQTGEPIAGPEPDVTPEGGEPPVATPPVADPPQPKELTAEEKRQIAHAYVRDNESEFYSPEPEQIKEVKDDDLLDEYGQVDPTKVRAHLADARAQGSQEAERNIATRLMLQKRAVAEIRAEHPEMPEEIADKLAEEFLNPGESVQSLARSVQNGAHKTFAESQMWRLHKAGKLRAREIVGEGEPAPGRQGSVLTSEMVAAKEAYRRITGGELSDKDAQAQALVDRAYAERNF